jgi:hypothetical protein
MRFNSLLSFAVLAAAGVAFAATAALADSPRPLRRAPVYPVPAGEAVGCYWVRGHQYCGSYCYWEVNGRRYCQRREGRATPQGAWIDDYILDESLSPLYRRPYGPVKRKRTRQW